MTNRSNPRRHEHNCKVCAHAKREDVEQEFTSWVSPGAIAKSYGLTRDSIYRHAHACGLFDRRRRNVRAALERIIEKAGEVEVNASAVVQAVATYAKLNSEGRLVERTERVNLNDLFQRMTQNELEDYAKNGRLPVWFSNLIATGEEGQGNENAE